MRQYAALVDELIVQLDIDWRKGNFNPEHENDDFIVFSKPFGSNAFSYMLGIPTYFIFAKDAGVMIQGVDDLSTAKKLVDEYSKQKKELDIEVQSKSTGIVTGIGNGPTTH